MRQGRRVHHGHPMTGTNRARIHVGLTVTALAAVALAHGLAATQPASQRTPTTATARYLANASVLVTHGDT